MVRVVFLWVVIIGSFNSFGTSISCKDIMIEVSLNFWTKSNIAEVARVQSEFVLDDFFADLTELSKEEAQLIAEILYTSLNNPDGVKELVPFDRQSSLQLAALVAMSSSSKDRQDRIQLILDLDFLSANEIEEVFLMTTPLTGFPSAMAALADLREVIGEHQGEKPWAEPQAHPVMTQLYGEEAAQNVFDRLEEISRRFNRLCQNIAYGTYWADDHLPIFEKSAVTIVTLMLLGREEQLQIHLRGFKNLAGSLLDVNELVAFIKSKDLGLDLDKVHFALAQVYGNEQLKHFESAYGTLGTPNKPYLMPDERLLAVKDFFTGNNQSRGMYRQFSVYAGGLRRPQVLLSGGRP